MSESSVTSTGRDQGFLRREQSHIARAACALLIGALIAAAATIAGGVAFSASTLGGFLLMLPAFVALLLACLAFIPGRGQADNEKARRLGSSTALASAGLLLFGCSWVVLVHNL